LEILRGSTIRTLRAKQRGITLTAHHVEASQLTNVTDLHCWANARFVGSLTPVQNEHPVRVMCETYWNLSELADGEMKFTPSSRSDNVVLSAYIKRRKGIWKLKPVECTTRIQIVDKIPSSSKYQITAPTLPIARIYEQSNIETCEFEYFVDTRNSMAAYAGQAGMKEKVMRG